MARKLYCEPHSETCPTCDGTGTVESITVGDPPPPPSVVARTVTAAPKRTLFDIGSDLLTLDQLIEDVGGDVSDPQVCAAVDALTAELARDEGCKLDGWIGYVHQLEMELAAANAQVEQWQQKARARGSRIAWVKAVLKRHLEGTRRTKVLTAAGRQLSIQPNGGKVPVQIDPTDPATVEERFRRVRVELNTEAVRAAVEGGEVVPFARLVEKGTHLRIR